MNHRLISAGFAARDQLPGGVIPADATIHVKAPFGSLVPLRVDDPRTGLEAKFCGPYNIAAALAQGRVRPGGFRRRGGDSTRDPRPDGPHRFVGRPARGGGHDWPHHGAVRLTIESGGRKIAFAEIESYPGSPKRPATEAEMNEKIDDCLSIYRRRSNGGPTLAEFRTDLRERLGLLPAYV